MNIEKFSKLNETINNSLKNNYSSNKCGCCLPNRKKIKNTTLKILEIIYPGFYSECAKNDSKEHREKKLKDAFDSMFSQIKLSLSNENLQEEQLIEKAEKLTFEFFEQLPKIIDYAYSDVEEAFNGDPAATDKNIIIATYPGIFATTVQRLAHELYLMNIPYIPRIMTEYAHEKTGIDIHLKAFPEPFPISPHLPFPSLHPHSPQSVS